MTSFMHDPLSAHGLTHNAEWNLGNLVTITGVTPYLLQRTTKSWYIFVQFDYVIPETFAVIIIINKWYKSPYAFLQLISEMFQSTNGQKEMKNSI